MMSSVISCSMCNFNAPTRSLWLSHLRSVHRDDVEFNVTCGIDNCANTYTRCASFVTHVYRQHRESFIVHHRGTSESGQGSFHVENETFWEIDGNRENNSSQDEDIQHAVNQLLEVDQDVQRKKGALFILNLKEVRCLSESSIEHIISETQKIFRHTIGHIKAGVNECISMSGNNPSDMPNLTQFFTTIEQPFNGLHSVFLRENFYRDELGCIVSYLEQVYVGYTHIIIIAISG